MTKDQIEIIRMACEAGFEHRFDVVCERLTEPFDRDEYLANPVVKQSFRTEHVEVLERFAALVAAKEREACAQVCEAKADRWASVSEETCNAMEACAVAIRARSAP